MTARIPCGAAPAAYVPLNVSRCPKKSSISCAGSRGPHPADGPRVAELIHPSFAELDTRLYELEERGFTVFPGFLDLATTAEIRAHMDSLIGPVGSTERPRSDLRHPIPGEIMPRIANNPAALELGGILIRSHDLRMREQVLIRADPSPPPYAKPSYHIDAAFRQVEFETTPRQVYYQMLHYCNTVAPGGAAIHIVPGLTPIRTKPFSERAARMSGVLSIRTQPAPARSRAVSRSARMRATSSSSTHSVSTPPRTTAPISLATSTSRPSTIHQLHAS